QVHHATCHPPSLPTRRSSDLLIRTRHQARPTQLFQFQQLNAATIQGVPIVSMGEAIDTVRQIAEEEAPRGYTFDYAGPARQFIQEGSALYVTFALAVAIIFLVLAAQFERSEERRVGKE